MADETPEPRILQVMPADGWSIRWRDDHVTEPLIGWALVEESGTGIRYVSGVYYAAGSQTELAGWFEGEPDRCAYEYVRDLG